MVAKSNFRERLSSIFRRSVRKPSPIVTAPDSDAIRETLLRHYPDSPDLITSRDTELVVEGFPRSSNTFFVTLLRHQQRTHDQNAIKIAHHTHRYENLLLALEYSKPAVVLVRKPDDALASLALFNQRKVSINELGQRYRVFYEYVTQNESHFLTASFNTVVSDPNLVLGLLHERWGINVPRVTDLESTKSEVAQLTKSRSRKNRDEAMHIARTAAPNEGRRALKEKLMPEVRDVCERLELFSLYDAVSKV